MPGPHKGEAFAKVFKLGTQEVVDIKLLEFQEGFFDVVWTVISFQGFRTLIWDCYKYLYCYFFCKCGNPSKANLVTTRQGWVEKSKFCQKSWLKICPAGVRL